MKTEKKDFIKVPWVFWKSVSNKMDYIEGYIFLYLAQYCYGSKTECYPTQKTISLHTGIPLVTVKRKIKSLIERGVLEIVKRTRNDKPKWNTYRLTEWDQIPFCTDWYDTEKVKKSVESSKDTLQGIIKIPVEVSPRDIKKINTIRLIQEDKFVADATSSSEDTNTTVSSGNRGEAPKYETNTMNTNSNCSAALDVSSTYDAMMANKDFVTKLKIGTLTDTEHDAFIAACEAKDIADEEEEKRKERERKSKLTINQLIEEEVNPALNTISSDSTEMHLFDAIWKHFKNKSDSYKYKRSLYALTFPNQIFEDPITSERLSDKEVLIRSQAMLRDYWTPEHWHGDGSLMMFICNFKSFYSDITIVRWRRLEDYCQENGKYLAKKCIKENRLLSIHKNKEAIKEILDSGIDLSDLQRAYLTSDPAEIEYNCVGVLSGNGWMLREDERHEISIETMSQLFASIPQKTN